MLAVIDTNVLVSALWSKSGVAARVIALVQNGKVTPCFDQRILTEYRDVLHRNKFGFEEWEILDLLNQIEKDGISVVPAPLNIPFTDQDDRMFYEVAKHCQAALITGNLRHVPDDPLVTSV
jgi:putative PIN family toxin of toxin-antitoxin system